MSDEPTPTELITPDAVVPESDGAARVGSVLAVIRDVTDQVHAQEASRTSEERLREVTEAIDEVFWLRDAADGRFIYVSSAYERVFGRCRDHLYADPGAWLDPVHPEDRERDREEDEQSIARVPPVAEEEQRDHRAAHRRGPGEEVKDVHFELQTRP